MFRLWPFHNNPRQPIRTLTNLKYTLARMGKVDKILNSWLSKKLFVFVTATALALFGNLTSADWVIIATTYIGTQGVIDAVSKLKGNN